MFKDNKYFEENYKLGNQIGYGASSKVFLIKNKEGKEFALKLININSYITNLLKKKPTPEYINIVNGLIKKELLLFNNIKNVPNTISYIEAYENLMINGEPYVAMIMEYFKGRELKKYLNCFPKDYNPSSNIIFKFFLDMLTTLKILHKKDFIHRDIKPQNILVDEKCNFCLIDFGLSCIIDSKIKEISCGNNREGTLNFMDPIIFGEYDAKDLKLMKATDIWSLGVVAYIFANNRKLHEGLNNIKRITEKIISGDRNPRSNHPNEDINILIELCLEKDYKKRPTAEELYDILIKMINKNEKHIDKKNMLKETIVPGLYIIEDFIDEKFEKELLKNINEQKWNTKLARRTQHYGREYDYSSKGVKGEITILPEWTSKVIDMAKNYPLIENPDQLIINEYEPGQGISAHIDKIEDFGPVVWSVSLGGNCTIVFEKDGKKESFYLKRRSLFIMSGDSRYKWTHEIPKRKSDTYNNKKIERTTRTSMTFRTLNKK